MNGIRRVELTRSCSAECFDLSVCTRRLAIGAAGTRCCIIAQLSLCFATCTSVPNEHRSYGTEVTSVDYNTLSRFLPRDLCVIIRISILGLEQNDILIQ